MVTAEQDKAAYRFSCALKVSTYSRERTCITSVASVAPVTFSWTLCSRATALSDFVRCATFSSGLRVSVSSSAGHQYSRSLDYSFMKLC